MGALIPWPGGKYYMTEQILPYFPEHNVYVEPFAGGAKVLFKKKRVPVEVINDLDGDLVNLFMVFKDKTQEFLERAQWLLVARDWFEHYKDTDPKNLDDVERAIRFWYLLKYSVNMNCSNYSMHRQKGRSINHALNTIRILHSRLNGVSVENRDFGEIIEYHDSAETFFFVDPPYLGYGKRLYKHSFGKKDFERLYTALSKVQGKWFMTHTDDQFIRDLFSEFFMVEETVHHSCKLKAERKQTELFIANYPLVRKQMDLPGVGR